LHGSLLAENLCESFVPYATAQHQAARWHLACIARKSRKRFTIATIETTKASCSGTKTDQNQHTLIQSRESQ